MAGRGDAPAWNDDGALELARELAASPPPEDPVPVQEAIARIDRAAAMGFDNAGPGFLAYIPGGGVYTAALAELISCVTNRFPSMAAPAPAFAAIEVGLLRWLCREFGLPDGALGIFTTGGSMANFSALVAARHARLSEDLRDATLYVSDQAHHSTAKAARLAGLPARAVRVVPTDGGLRMDVAALRAMLDADPRPFYVVASAGTTSTGAVDPLPEIADAAAAAGAWFHVDAAYGGFFGLTARGRERFAGIERADSITLDPHKGLFMPYGNGVLLVRDFAALGAAHSVDAGYLQDLAGEHAGIPDFSAYSPELSRGFRGLRVWLPLHVHGVRAFRAALDEKLDLALRLHDGLAADDRLEIVPGPPELSIVGWRLRDGDDAANRALQDAVNASRRVLLSSAVVDGRFTLRACILSFRTHADRIDELISLVRAAARA
ncbi:MAG TPA: aminotransferase class V-fold PLP-dependent enzyme [Solirubrobacteraceae bacterium]|nr:aminotransferase class V-fold PLP-dependent enzyme [Solirubrobacteraceae bacterium]